MEAGKWFGNFKHSATAKATVTALDLTELAFISQDMYEAATQTKTKPPPRADIVIETPQATAQNDARDASVPQPPHREKCKSGIDSMKFDLKRVGHGTFGQVCASFNTFIPAP